MKAGELFARSWCSPRVKISPARSGGLTRANDEVPFQIEAPCGYDDSRSLHAGRRMLHYQKHYVLPATGQFPVNRLTGGLLRWRALRQTPRCLRQARHGTAVGPVARAMAQGERRKKP